MTNKDIANKIFAAIGGLENIKSVAHCATRLRVMVRDKAKVDQNAIEDIEKVKGVFFTAGQYQIILGTGVVNKVYAEFVDLGAPTSSKADQTKMAANEGPDDFKAKLKRLIRLFGDVFVPIIPVLVATGLFMGLRGLVVNLMDYVPEDSNFILFTQIVTDTAFIFLPAFVTMSAFKALGATPMIGLTLGLMLVFPGLPNAWAVAGGDVEPIYFFGFIPVVGFQASVIPAFVVGLVGAKLENFTRKHVPDTFDLIITPFVTMLVMIFLGLFVIGPVFRSVEDAIIAGFEAMLSWPIGLGGAIIGGIHQVIVVTGVHHAFNALEARLITANDGMNPFNPIITAAMAGQIGAALAVGIKTRSAKLKALSFSSVGAGMLGITEPVIFGINLRFVKPFVFGLVAGAVGGAFASILNLQANGMGITMIPGLIAYVDRPLQLVGYVGVILISMGIAGALTFFFGFTDSQIEELKRELNNEPQPLT